MQNIPAYASHSPTGALEPYKISRRELLPHDIRIEILFCGICHSDLHQARNEWGATSYPCVPGHEIVGRITEVGAHVKKFKVGDLAGVGCMVDSCRECSSCQENLEQFCEAGVTFTYNSPDKLSGGITYGGYSQSIVLDEAFTLHIPKNLDLAAVAPLLCAGITTYSPLRYHGVKKGSKVGIVGLGGLGHMALKISHAMEAHTVLFTTSAAKVADAKRLGAKDVVISTDPTAMKAHTGTFDYILDTVSADHDLNPYLELLKRDATLTVVGVPPIPAQVAAHNLIAGRKKLDGSLIGGIAETQEMLEFCSAHNIVSDIEIISIQGINEAYERLLRADVKYRFVVDMKTLA